MATANSPRVQKTVNGVFAIAKQGGKHLNYRHAFHAGNFADVHKHALLTRLVESFKRKDKAFRVYDTHAGVGVYDLASEAALRTGEAKVGIDLFMASSARSHPLLAAYAGAVETVDSVAGHRAYPGSPMLIRRLLRPQDRLSAYELHPEDARALADTFAGDVQVKAIHLDGWLALGAHLPPKEKRGMVLIDPPFEEAGEFQRIVDHLRKAVRRWAGGTFAVWYPIKRRSDVTQFHDALSASLIPYILALDFLREDFGAEDRLVGSGLIVINPPYGFAEEARTIMEVLLPVLSRSSTAHCGINVLAAERI